MFMSFRERILKICLQVNNSKANNNAKNSQLHAYEIHSCRSCVYFEKWF